MHIAEIFYSIQGEGELTGVPSVFVRTSGCNLRCDWCDTKYASWYPEGQGMEIADIVVECCKYPTNHVVLTGGEPMIAKGIHELAEKLSHAGKHITIETAGTVAPEFIYCDLASLSPKLSNSTPTGDDIGHVWRAKHEERRLNLDVISEWLVEYEYQLKFVVCSQTDLDEIDQLLYQLGRHHIPPTKVMLMPEGISAAGIRERDETLVEICKRRGFRYCNRLHIELFGNTKGT